MQTDYNTCEGLRAILEKETPILIAQIRALYRELDKKFHQSILKFAEKNLSDDKKVFLICTYGGSANYRSIEQILDKKHASVVGKFGCKGYDTFGPFKLVGGIAKGHPDDKDIQNAVEFVKDL